jgi:hypothetical protein
VGIPLAKIRKNPDTQKNIGEFFLNLATFEQGIEVLAE